MDLIDNENLKTKVYKSKRNKKPYVKKLKIETHNYRLQEKQ